MINRIQFIFAEWTPWGALNTTLWEVFYSNIFLSSKFYHISSILGWKSRFHIFPHILDGGGAIMGNRRWSCPIFIEKSEHSQPWNPPLWPTPGHNVLKVIPFLFLLWSTFLGCFPSSRVPMFHSPTKTKYILRWFCYERKATLKWDGGKELGTKAGPSWCYHISG